MERKSGISPTKGKKNPLFRCTRVYEDASNKVGNPTKINTSEMLILSSDEESSRLLVAALEIIRDNLK